MKKRIAAILLSVVIALLVLIPTAIYAGDRDTASPALSSREQVVQKGEEKDKDKKAKEELPDYKLYLDNTKELGFSPTTAQFERIHGYLETQFYGNATSAKLLESTRAEILRLANAAKLPDLLKDSSCSTPEELLNVAIKEYGDKLNNDLITYAALCGLLKGTDDPYTVYMTPKEYSILMEQMQSASFGGLGIYIELDPENEKWLTIIETIEGTPAERAGLKAGDIIAEIDGASTRGISIDVAVSKLRGLKGSPVTLTIRRKGVSGSMKVTLNREQIQVKSVTSKIINNNVGYLKLRLFGSDTSKEVHDALQSLQEQGVRAIVLDLRNNGGGYINAAIDVASAFISRGDSVVVVKDKSGRQQKHTARGDFRCNLPLIILVNKYSASASEITAGAIKDYKRGILIGTKTFGKGSVQQVVPFPDGSALKITVSHYYTPNGNDIDKHGLEPDYKVEMEPKDVGKEKDPQLDKALEVIKTTTKR